MVKLYFGLPGAGKTTLLAKFAFQTDKQINKGRSPYKRIYGNVHLNGLKNYTYIEYSSLGKYQVEDALVLIDEATLEQDSRDYKSFSHEKKAFFLLHRHYNVDIILFTQQWDGIDKKIRVITDSVYYLYRPVFFGKWITRYYRIPYGIIIPDPKKTDSEKLGDIVQGYCKPPLLVRLFCSICVRKPYYKLFDSWECPVLPPLPDYKETGGD